MYAEDMPRIAAHGLASPEGFVDVATFVLLTIQQPLQNVASQMEDVRRHEADSRFLFGAKRDGYRYLQAHKETLHGAAVAAVKAGDVVGALDVFTNVPSLGMVKAAFLAQCLELDVACLDTHNLNRLGLTRAAVTLPKGVKRDTKLAKLRAYVALTLDTGGAAYWWDTWCDYVAGRRKSPLKTAQEVSAFHVAAIGAA